MDRKTGFLWVLAICTFYSHSSTTGAAVRRGRDEKREKILKNLPPHSLAAIGSFSWFYCQEGEMVPFLLPKTLQLQNHDWGMIFKLKPWEKREKKKWDSHSCVIRFLTFDLPFQPSCFYLLFRVPNGDFLYFVQSFPCISDRDRLQWAYSILVALGSTNVF